VGKAGDVGATVAYDPDDTAIEAGVQIAAGTVLGEEGVEVGQEAHLSERCPVGPAAIATRARRRGSGKALRSQSGIP